MEESPFGFGGKLRKITPSRESHAGQALADLLNLDLGPPFGPQFFGVHWEPEYRGRTSILTRRGFKFLPQSILVLVGMKPVEDALINGVYQNIKQPNEK